MLCDTSGTVAPRAHQGVVIALLLLGAWLVWVLAWVQPAQACTSGGAMKAATVDGRPIIWQNMDWGDHKVVLRKHEATGGQHDAMEIVKHGASIGWNALNAKGVGHVVNKLSAFGPNGGLTPVFASAQRKCATINEFKAYLDARGTQQVGENFLLMDGTGRIVDFEVGPSYYYPYDPENSTRQQQSFFAKPKMFVARGNNPFKNTQHKEPDSVVDTWGYASSRFRYRTAREQFIKRITNGNKLTVEEMLGIARWGNAGYDTYTISRPDKGKTGYSIWSVVMLGVKAGDSPQYATMLVSLGLPDYGIFIPVWVDLSQAELSKHVTTWDSDNIATWSYKLFEQRFDKTEDYDNYINGIFKPVQDNITAAVKAARAQWLDKGNTANAHRDMKNLHQYAAYAAYHTVKSAYETAANGSGTRNCNRPPAITSLGASANGLKVSFAHNANDPDSGDSVTFQRWRFGDGATVKGTATPTHTYSKPGTYQVMCYVGTGSGIRYAANVKFQYITVTAKTPDAGVPDATVADAAPSDASVSDAAPDSDGLDAGAGDGALADASDAAVAVDTGTGVDSRIAADASISADSGTIPTRPTEGCAMASSGRLPFGPLMLLAPLGLLALRRRRRRSA